MSAAWKFIRSKWRWGPVALGVSAGASLMPSYFWLGLAFMLGGVLVSLALLAGPPLAAAAGNALIRGAYEREGLSWPPVTEEKPAIDPGDLREALQKIAVELENNALLLEDKLEDGKVWNSRARGLDATAYKRHSTLLSRYEPFTSHFQTLSTLYNAMNAFNHSMFLQFTMALNNKRVSKLTNAEREKMTDLAERATTMREAVLGELP